MPQVEYNPNPPSSREEFESDANNGPGYTYMKYLDSVLEKDPGRKSPRRLIINLACEEDKSAANFIKQGIAMLKDDITSLNGEYGDLVVNHCRKYLLDKYEMVNPLRAKMIRQVMTGTPYSLFEDKEKVEALARFQQVYLQCLANWAEMAAGILCFEKDLEMSLTEQYYVRLDLTDPIFRPGPIVKRSAIELRFLLLTFEVQLDAKAILISEKRINPHARENRAEIESLEERDIINDFGEDEADSEGSGYDPHPASSDEEEEAQSGLIKEKAGGPIELDEIIDYEDMEEEGAANENDDEVEAHDNDVVEAPDMPILADSEGDNDSEETDDEDTFEFESDSDNEMDFGDDSGLGTEPNSSAVLEDAAEDEDEQGNEAEVINFHHGNIPV